MVLLDLSAALLPDRADAESVLGAAGKRRGFLHRLRDRQSGVPGVPADCRSVVRVL